MVTDVLFLPGMKMLQGKYHPHKEKKALLPASWFCFLLPCPAGVLLCLPPRGIRPRLDTRVDSFGISGENWLVCLSVLSCFYLLVNILKSWKNITEEPGTVAHT